MSTPYLTSDHADWDALRMPWNVAVDQRPAAVVRAESSEDVADAVRVAAQRGLRVMVQNTGHAASPRHDLSDVVLIRTTGLTGVEVDPSAQIARVAAGTQWQQVAEAAAGHGLAGLAGSSGGVGVVGYTLGGGLGWLGREHGFACGRLVAADVVLADGTQRRIDDTDGADLMWALRGGGGCFAAVTSVDLELVPVSEVYGGTLFFPAERAAEVLTAWSAWTDTVPESVTSTGRVVNMPPLETVPAPLRGRSFVLVQAVFLTPESTAVELLGPLRELGAEIDTFASMPATGLGMIHMDPPEPVPADLEGWLIDRFDVSAIDGVVARSGSGSPLLAVQVRHLGGALSRSGRRPAALDRVDSRFLVYGVGVTPEPAAAAEVRKGLTALGEAIAPASRGGTLMNFAEESRSQAFFGDDTLARLAEVRAAYDPGRRFVAAHDLG